MRKRSDLYIKKKGKSAAGNNDFQGFMARPPSRVNYIWQIRFPRIFAFGKERERPVGSEIESSPLRAPESGTSLHMRGERRRTRRRGRYRIRVRGETRKRAAARTRCHSFPAHNEHRHNAWFYAIVCAARGTSVCIGLHACRTNTCVRAYGLSDSYLFRSRLRHARVSTLLSLSLITSMDLPAFFFASFQTMCLFTPKTRVLNSRIEMSNSIFIRNVRSPREK